MTQDEIEDGENEIQEFIPDFNYRDVFQITQDKCKMRNIYKECNSNYEKLQVYRIICEDNHPNKVVRKHINECYHVENDLLFQLDPCQYDTIPQYLINECEADMNMRKE